MLVAVGLTLLDGEKGEADPLSKLPSVALYRGYGLALEPPAELADLLGRVMAQPPAAQSGCGGNDDRGGPARPARGHRAAFAVLELPAGRHLEPGAALAALDDTDELPAVLDYL